MTEEEQIAFIWTKYRAPAAEKRAGSSSSSKASSSGRSSTSSQGSTRASSSEASEYSSGEISTPSENSGASFAVHVIIIVLIYWLLVDDNVEVVNYSPFDQLVRVASLAGAEHMLDREASEALLSLRGSH